MHNTNNIVLNKSEILGILLHTQAFVLLALQIINTAIIPLSEPWIIPMPKVFIMILL